MRKNNNTTDIQIKTIQKQKCESLAQARAQIDMIDQQLLEMIAARQFYVDQAARFKRTVLAVQSPERVEQVLEKVRAQATALDLDPALIEQIYSAMIQHFIQRELKELRP